MSTEIIDLTANVTTFYCPYQPVFTWILSDSTTFLSASIITGIACPVTIFLNILVIRAVSKRGELQTNSNILLASMAVADMLVGAASMPLSISLDVLLLRKDLSHTICEIAFVNQLVLYASACTSLYHLTVIAWERYVAVTKWMHYNALFRINRTKKLAIVAWLLALLTTTPGRILKAAGVQYRYLQILNTIFTLPGAVCVALIMYFYIRVYRGMHKRVNTEMNYTEKIRKRRENAVAKNTLMLTVVLLVCYVPSLTVLFFGMAVPFLRTSSFFRWSELLIQINSLVNPFLYCFAFNSQLRAAILETLNIRKNEVKPKTGYKERRAWRMEIEDILEKREELQRQHNHTVATSQTADIFLQPYQPNKMEEIESTSSCEIKQVICVDVHNPKTIGIKTTIPKNDQC